MVAACAGETEPPELESIPPATVPSGWITYTDETASIQLAYPSEWVQMEVDMALVEEILNPLADEADIEVGSFAFVFGAGVPIPHGQTSIVTRIHPTHVARPLSGSLPTR